MNSAQRSPEFEQGAGRKLGFRNRKGRLVAFSCAVALFAVLPHTSHAQRPGVNPPRAQGSRQLAEVQSEFNLIRIREARNIRTMLFVRDNQQEVEESAIDLNHPHRLLYEYTRCMFASYLFRPEQKNVAIVGLGGGSMVHFLRHYDPEVKIDAIEIDPAVIKAAQDWFLLKPDDNLNVATQNGLTYFDGSKQYDVIYMDAFLKPTQSTDETGVPLDLKTTEYYGELKKSLTENGLVVFNINPHQGIDRDVQVIKQSFPQVYALELSGGGLVVLASTSPNRSTYKDLDTNGAALDKRFKATFSFLALARAFRKPR